MRVFHTITGGIVLVFGLWAGFNGHLGVMTISFLSFVMFLFVANLNLISEFKASGSGIEAKTREVIARAEITLTELQLLAKTVSEVTLSLVKRNGRLGGYTDDEADSIKDSVLVLLGKLGTPDSDFPKILQEWHRFVEFDYTHAILGGGYVPDQVNAETIEEWKKLRDGGIVNIPTPDAIRSFLNKHALMTKDIEEYLQDYEHYRQTKIHRRPNVWAARRNWGRLTKQG